MCSNITGLVEDTYNPSNIPLVSVDIKAEILNLTTNVTTTFVYENKFDRYVNAAFQFPTSNAAIYYFEVELEGRKIVSLCRALDEATTTYDEAVSSGYSAFLGRHGDQSEDRFRMNLGLIPPNATVIINLKYIGHLDVDFAGQCDTGISKVTLTLPSVMNPRYTPKGSNDTYECDVFNSPPTTNSIPYNVNFCAVLHMQHPIWEVTSIKDRFDLQFCSGDHRRAKVDLTSEFKSDHDLQLIISMHGPLTHLLAYEPGDGSQTGLLSMHCLMAQFMPEFASVVSKREERTELVFVIDRSGSMDGTSIQHASSSLLLFLKSLPTTCRFQIIGFGSHHATLFDEPVDYTEETLARALDYQRTLDADMGGTEVYPALAAAFEAPLIGQAWYRQIIFITDGDVSNANEIIGLVKRNVNKARVFAIGIGEGANTFLIPGVASAGRGLAAFVRDSCQLQPAVMKILNTALQPRAGEVHVTWKVQSFDQKTSVWQPVDIVTVPKYVAPVFSGCFLTVFALVHGDNVDLKGDVELTYELTGQKQKLHVNFDRNSLPNSATVYCSKDLALHRLAGRSQLMDLSNEYRAASRGREDDPDEALMRLRWQIEQLSTGINVLSMFTALVGVDSEKIADPSAPVDQQAICAPIIASGMPIRVGTDQLDCCPAPQVFDSLCMFDEQLESSELIDEPMPDSGKSTVREVVNRNAEQQPKDPLIILAELQYFSGFWELSKELADCLNTSVDKLKNDLPRNVISQPGTKPRIGDERIWATILVLEFFKALLCTRHDEWILLAEKAHLWLTQHARLSSTIILNLSNSAKASLINE